MAEIIISKCANSVMGRTDELELCGGGGAVVALLRMLACDGELMGAREGDGRLMGGGGMVTTGG